MIPLPPPTYTILPGDTLSDIALKMGVTVDELMEINGIDDPDVIIAGRVLTLPAGTRTAGGGNTGKTSFVGQTQGNDEVGVMEKSNEEKIDMLKRSGYTDAQIRDFISEGKLDSMANYVTQGEFANPEKIGAVPGYPEDGQVWLF